MLQRINIIALYFRKSIKERYLRKTLTKEMNSKRQSIYTYYIIGTPFSLIAMVQSNNTTANIKKNT
jgi:hypothetical protein